MEITRLHLLKDLPLVASGFLRSENADGSINNVQSQVGCKGF